MFDVRHSFLVRIDQGQDAPEDVSGRKRTVWVASIGCEADFEAGLMEWVKLGRGSRCVWGLGGHGRITEIAGRRRGGKG